MLDKILFFSCNNLISTSLSANLLSNTLRWAFKSFILRWAECTSSKYRSLSCFASANIRSSCLSIVDNCDAFCRSSICRCSLSTLQKEMGNFPNFSQMFFFSSSLFIENITEFDGLSRPSAIWFRYLCCYRFGSTPWTAPDQTPTYSSVRIVSIVELLHAIDSIDQCTFASFVVLLPIAECFVVHWSTLNPKCQCDCVALAKWLAAHPIQYPDVLWLHSTLCLEGWKRIFVYILNDCFSIVGTYSVWKVVQLKFDVRTVQAAGSAKCPLDLS